MPGSNAITTTQVPLAVDVFAVGDKIERQLQWKSLSSHTTSCHIALQVFSLVLSQGFEDYRYFCKRFYEEWPLNDDGTLADVEFVNGKKIDFGGCFDEGKNMSEDVHWLLFVNIQATLSDGKRAGRHF